MIQKAIEKINSEMQKSPNDRQLEVIGQYLIDRCRDEGTAAALLDKGKSLTGFMAELKKEAEKRAVNGFAMIADEEVFRMLRQYYGLDAELPPGPAPASSALPSLDDFL